MISSVITPSATISYENWAVTTVTNKGSLHVLLVFEGVKQDTNSYFARVADLNTEGIGSGKCTFYGLKKIGEVNLTDEFSIDKFKTSGYSKKSHTWVTTREKIEFLIEKIKIEFEKPQPFNILGEKSKLSKEVEVYTVHNEFFRGIALQYEDLFLKLYDSWKNEKKCTGMSEEKFNEEIDKIVESLGNIYPDLIQKDIDYSFKNLMEMFDDETVTLQLIQQNNCYTWAANHLKSIGLKVSDTDLYEKCSKVACYSLFVCNNPINADGKGIVIYDENSDYFEPITQEKTLENHLVTYKKNRDKRTEDYKDIQKKNNINKVKLGVGKLGFLSGFVTSGIGIGFIAGGGIATATVITVAAPVLIIAGGTAVAAGGIVAMSRACKERQMLKQMDIKDKVTTQEFQNLKNEFKK